MSILYRTYFRKIFPSLDCEIKFRIQVIFPSVRYEIVKEQNHSINLISAIHGIVHPAEHEYTSKFNLSVIELNHIDMATEEDRKYGVDKWAKLFKSTTWEEVKALTEHDKYIQSAARSMFKKELDEGTLRLCRRLQEEIDADEHRRQRLIELEAENAEQTTTISNQAATINDQAATINNLTSTVDDQAKVIEQLKKELAILKE